MPPPIRCVSHSTSINAPHQSLPPWGKVARRKPGRMRGRAVCLLPAAKKPTLQPLISQKSKIFASFSPGRSLTLSVTAYAVPPLPEGEARGAENPLRHGFAVLPLPGGGKGGGVPSLSRSAACCCSPPGSGEGLCCGEEMINLSQKPGGSRNKSRGKLVNMSI